MPPRAQLIWLGGELMDGDGALVLHGREHAVEIPGTDEELDWLAEVIASACPDGEPLRFEEARAAFPGAWTSMVQRWRGVREAGLVGI